MIQRDAALRLCKAVLFDELTRLAPDRARRMPPALWTAETRLDEEGLGFDSLARIEVISAMNARFALHRTGVEDYMYVHPELGIWSELLTTHFSMVAPDVPIAFHTSGSTGTPKVLHHPLNLLVEEMDAQAVQSIPQGIRRIVSLVPPHHIYGFLFTVLLPARLELPVLDLSGKGPGALSREIRAGDLVVGTPHLYGHVLPLLSGIDGVAHALTSTAPAPASLWEDVAQAGLASLTEIYGSSETGGVGFRAQANAPFRLLSYLDPGNPPLRDGQPIDLQDNLSWEDARVFRVTGRRDKAVQVAGHNVSLQAVRIALEADPDVTEAQVRLQTGSEGDRLKAFVVPRDGVDPGTLEDRLRRRMEAEHAPAARPASYRFGAAIPRNAMGKVVDWPTSDTPSGRAAGKTALPPSEGAAQADFPTRG